MQSDKTMRSWPVRFERQKERKSCSSVQGKASPKKRIPHVVLEVVVDTWYGGRG